MLKVFFLGAGFSKAINPHYPTLAELTKAALDKFKELYTNHPLFECYELIPGSLKSDIEILLTYLHSNLPWKDIIQENMDQALYIAITKSIADVINSVDKNSCLPFSKDLIKFIIEDKNPIIATLNYDMLFENILNSIADKYSNTIYSLKVTNINNCFQREIHDTQKLLDKTRAIKLLKLHGSLDTLLDPKKGTFTYTENAENPEMLMPYIVPPILDKTSFYDIRHLKGLWSTLQANLKRAGEIYIIGTSFPKTDISLKYLFQTSIMRSNPRIYVVNTSSKRELAKNYNEVFKGYKNIDYTFTGMDNPLEEFTAWLTEGKSVATKLNSSRV